MYLYYVLTNCVYIEASLECELLSVVLLLSIYITECPVTNTPRTC